MLRDLITDAVERKLAVEPDQLAGLALSGGLDSSTVACTALQIQPRLLMFTGWYDVPGFDERHYADLVDGRHVYIEIEPEDVIDNFDAVMRHCPEPLQGPGMIGQYVVAREAALDIEVLLSGEGADELFGGYARQMIVAGEQAPAGYEHYLLPKGYPHDLEGALEYDLMNLPDLLAVDDAMCGAHGVEARAPFTDEKIVDYTLNLPASERVGKRHLRERVRGLVPDEIIDRTDKMGFPIPLVHWCQDELRDWVIERIGYVPDPAKPFDRGWWSELVKVSKAALA